RAAPVSPVPEVSATLGSAVAGVSGRGRPLPSHPGCPASEVLRVVGRSLGLPGISDRVGRSGPTWPFPSLRPSRPFRDRNGRTGNSLFRQARQLELDARAHGRAQRYLLDVDALGARRLGAVDRRDEGLDVLGQLVGLEARLADAGMDDTGLLGAELDLAAL